MSRLKPARQSGFFSFGNIAMKYAFMTFSCPELTLEQALAAAKEYGYDGIEPRAQSEHKHGIELDASAAERAEIKRQAEQSGIALCCIATSCQYADPATAEEHVETTRKFIDLAADVGSPRLRVFGGLLPDGVNREQAAELLTKSLNSVADQAAERNVTVCMETHDDWCNPEHLAEVMRRVNQPAIAVNWDIMHPVRSSDWDMAAAYEILKPWIKHVHFHDGIKGDDGNPLRPIGQGIIDHRAAVQSLQKGAYAGFLSGEWIGWTPWQEHLPAELATMKGYET